MRGRIGLRVVLGAAAVLVVTGVAVVLFAPFSTGWFSYTAGGGSVSFDFHGMYPLTPERAVGFACAIAGLLLVAGALGWVLGRRSAPTASRQLGNE
ncbi:hypothetical protein ACFVWR_07775 [Leifsonia sp. NPDC058292]|uniref:hypothetical protein n=1 Tax=Leifsonia sp. NPDC058292 TaxID=3346428 RepID=UPI0036DD5ACD